ALGVGATVEVGLAPGVGWGTGAPHAASTTAAVAAIAVTAHARRMVLLSPEQLGAAKRHRWFLCGAAGRQSGRATCKLHYSFPNTHSKIDAPKKGIAMATATM